MKGNNIVLKSLMGTGIQATLRNGRNCSVNGTIDPDAEPARELDNACNDHMSELSSLSISDGGGRAAVLATHVSKIKQPSFTSDGNDIISLEAFTLSLLRKPVYNLKKKLLILDLNGLLVDVVTRPAKDFKADIRIGKQAVFRRPFCLDFLNFCLARFEVGIWSSRMKKNVDRIVDYLMGDLKQKLMFCWDMSQCTTTRFNTLENKYKPLVFKELKRIWDKEDPELPWERGYYTESNTLLLDDSPYKALLNPAYTAIFPFPYQFTDKNDNSLANEGDIKVYLEELAGAENVQTFVEQNPFGQKAITENLASWGFYSQVLNSLA